MRSILRAAALAAALLCASFTAGAQTWPGTGPGVFPTIASVLGGERIPAQDTNGITVDIEPVQLMQYLAANGAIFSMLPSPLINGSCLSTNGTVLLWQACGFGTVTSVGLTVPTWLSVLGSPVTASGTFAVTGATGQATYEVVGTDASGAVALRVLPAAAVPPVNLAGAGNGGVFGVTPIANGGTGTAVPGLIAGTNVTITGSWPNQTISASGGGGSFPSCTANQLYYAASSGTTATCLTLGTNLSITTGTLNATAGGGGVSSFSGDGVLLSNSGSTGGVTATLANTGVGYGVWGNIGAASGAPGYHALSSYPAAAFPTLNQATTGNAATATALSTTGGNGTFWGVSGGIQGYYTPAGGGNVSNTGTPTSGQFAEWTSSTVIGGQTLGGDCTLSTATITCTKTSGTAFSALATTVPGTGVATFLSTPTAANLGSAVTGAGLVAGTNVTITGTWPNQTITASATGATAFSALTGSTNTAAAMIVGTGASLATSGAGTIAATSAPLSGISGLGTGVATALGINVGTTGAVVTLNGAGGTPSSMTATNLTGTAAGLTAGTASAVAVGGITGLGTGIATFLATPSSANFAAAVTGETGTGAVVFGNSPTLVTPALGTPSAINLANATNLPNSALPTSGATAGSYTSANITVNAQGIVTAAANGTASATSITPGTTTISGATSPCLIANTSSTVMGCPTLQGLAIVSGVIGPSAANRTVTTSPTVLSTDMGGQLAMNVSGGGTLTIPAIGSGVFGNGQSLSVVNYSASTAAVSTTPTVNSGGGCVSGTGIPSGDSWQILSNGTTLDCIQTTPNSGGSSAFSSLTSGTNTAMAGVVGSGASLDYTGTGTIDANKLMANAIPTLASGYLHWTGSAWAFSTPSGSAPTVRTVTTSSDTILSTDCGNIVSYNFAGAIAVTLPQATGSFATCSVTIENVTPTVHGLTVTPTTSTIDTGLTSLGINSLNGCTFTAQGGNYYTSGCTSQTSLSGGRGGITGTLGVANGGTGAATLTGVLKGNGTSAFTAAAAADVYALWSGTCSASTYLRGDGSCATPSGGGNVSNSGTPTNGQLAQWTSSTVIQGLTIGTGVATALGVNVGSAGAFITFNGALGTPSSGTATNLTGLPVGGIASIGADTIVANASGSTASPTAVSVSAFEMALLQAATTFTIAPTGCTPSAHVGSATAGTITLASGPCTSIVITMNGATGLTAPNGWHCNVGDKTAMSTPSWIQEWPETSSTTTTATISVPAAAGATDVLSFNCTGY